MDFLFVIIGLLLLVGTGDALVRGAVALSLKLGMPAFLVSATIVAFGTSAPELLISVEAALAGSPGIALGNVVGSNIANVWLVLGIPALIAPIAGCGSDAHRNLHFMVIATMAFTLLVLPGTIWWWGGLVLLCIVIVMVTDSVRQGMLARANGGVTSVDDLAELEDADPSMPAWKVSLLIAIGIVGLPAGAHLLIEGARGVAMSYGVSEAVIGLTIVAVGTSLPELATTVMAALRNQADVAIGNVIGSNLFNLTAIIGTASLFAPLGVPDEILDRDLWIMIVASATLIPYVLLNKRICRLTGIGYLLAYGGFLALAITA